MYTLTLTRITWQLVTKSYSPALSRSSILADSRLIGLVVTVEAALFQSSVGEPAAQDLRMSRHEILFTKTRSTVVGS